MSDNTNYSFTQKSISVKDIALEFMQRRYIVAIIIACALLVSFIYSTFIATPLYSSQAKLYVVNKQSQNITSSDLSVSTYLARDFAEIIVDDVVLDKVAESLDGKYTTGQLKSFISIEIPESTRIISITVLSPKAEDSKKIADSICTVSQDTLVELMDLDKIEILSEGKVSKTQTSPVLSSNLLFGLICGIIISIAAVFAIYSFDNKISSSQDVEKYLDITVLATIPYNTSKKLK